MERFSHFILSNRKVHPHFKTFTPDWKLDSYKDLHYTPFEFEDRYYEERSHLSAVGLDAGQGFIDAVVESAKDLPQPYRNVTLYIHGFHHVINVSYKLDVMKGMTDAYCTQDENTRTVGKFIFFSWPATESRTHMAAVAWDMGVGMDTGKNAKLFEDLYAALKKENIQFNLMVHSFGHHLLNSFLWARNNEQNTQKLFDQVFLFAPDIPHGSLSQKGGMYNPIRKRHFNLNGLETVAGITHVYYYKHDRMLISGTCEEIRSAPKDVKVIVNRDHFCLGTVGDAFAIDYQPANIIFYDAFPMVRTEQRFQRAFDQGDEIRNMDRIVKEQSFKNAGQVAFNLLPITRQPWVDLHRYSYTSNKVVAHVRELYRTGLPVV